MIVMPGGGREVEVFPCADNFEGGGCVVRLRERGEFRSKVLLFLSWMRMRDQLGKRSTPTPTKNILTHS